MNFGQYRVGDQDVNQNLAASALKENLIVYQEMTQSVHFDQQQTQQQSVPYQQQVVNVSQQEKLVYQPVQPVVEKTQPSKPKSNRVFKGDTNETFIRDFFHLGIASILGGLARVAISSGFQTAGVTSYYGAMFIFAPANFFGCLIMGFFNPAKARITNFSSSLALFIGTGFCGSFTTWSSWNLETSQTFLSLSIDTSFYVNGEPTYQVTTAFAQLVVGFALASAGYVLGQQIHDMTIKDLPVSDAKADHRASLIATAILFFTMYAIIIAIIIIEGMKETPNQELQGYAVVLLFCPWGTLTRWQLGLNFNGIHWFPWGTFSANILGVTIGAVLFSIQGHYFQLKGSSECPMEESFQDALTVYTSVCMGFCGCCTTVSTWIAEQYSLKTNGQKWIYALISFVLSQIIGVIIMGIPFWLFSDQENIFDPTKTKCPFY